MTKTRDEKCLRLGTRSSALARWQADWVTGELEKLGASVELVPITTRGDVQQVGPIGSLGSQGVFTKEIQRALLEGEVDLAVHSLKDLPTEPVEGLSLAAVPERETASDALIAREASSLETLPAGAVVGTGSLRRRAQLLSVRNDLVVKDIRGNVETRLRKLDEGAYDAILLAVAGLVRLGLSERITEVLPHTVILPAVGQGALGIETRSDDHETRARLAPLNHLPTWQAVTAERAVLATLRGGCMAPVGAWGRVEGGQLLLTSVVTSLDGKVRLEETASSDPTDAENLGRQVAEALVAQGAGKLIEEARGQ